MVKPNNPYGRPINATKESAQTVGEYYGKRATDKVLNVVAGGRDVSPASRYQAVGNARAATPKPKAKPKAKPKPIPTEAVGTPAVSAEDLFG